MSGSPIGVLYVAAALVCLWLPVDPLWLVALIFFTLQVIFHRSSIDDDFGLFITQLLISPCIAYLESYSLSGQAVLLIVSYLIGIGVVHVDSELVGRNATNPLLTMIIFSFLYAPYLTSYWTCGLLSILLVILSLVGATTHEKRGPRKSSRSDISTVDKVATAPPKVVAMIVQPMYNDLRGANFGNQYNTGHIDRRRVTDARIDASTDARSVRASNTRVDASTANRSIKAMADDNRSFLRSSNTSDLKYNQQMGDRNRSTEMSSTIRGDQNFRHGHAEEVG